MEHEGTGYRVNSYSRTSVKASFRLKLDESFILPSQAKQVFYVEDLKDPNWLVVMKTYPQDLYTMPIQI